MDMEIHRGNPVRVFHSPGAALECMTGELWIARGTGDRMLGPGERLQIREGDEVYVVAFRLASLRLIAPPRQRWAVGFKASVISVAFAGPATHVPFEQAWKMEPA